LDAQQFAVALAFILRRTWVWFAGAAWIILMALSRTYLGAHWLSDTVGGALLGAGVAVLVWAPFAQRLGMEDPRPDPRPTPSVPSAPSDSVTS
jgi:undecaprenyl-diphosphatase